MFTGILVGLAIFFGFIGMTTGGMWLWEKDNGPAIVISLGVVCVLSMWIAMPFISG